MRVAIIGCGKVADKHASQIQRIAGCEIVGVCDREPLMAEQLAERFAVKRQFTNAQSLLESVQPDVVHIATSPQSHYILGKQCLDAGCHIYMEKPFTLNSREAADLIGIAETRKLKITVGHETQFMPVARDMRHLIQSGYLGGEPVHMESIYCYDLSDERYAKSLLGDKNHWIRHLPGKLLHNIISHGIGKIAEYLHQETVTVHAHGFTSRLLKSIGEPDIVDELRVIISDRQCTTAYFTFSSQMSPALHQFRVYGPKNSLIADYDHQVLLRLTKKSYKSYLNQFIPPFTDGAQQAANGFRNVRRFIRSEFHAESGIYFLIKSFYQSIRENSPLPIPYRDIILTASIMDKIFDQLQRAEENDSVESLHLT
jgi:predicted dehydrogenase